MQVGNRRTGKWLFIGIAVVLLGCLVAVFALRFHRQAVPQGPMHEQTRLLPGAPILPR